MMAAIGEETNSDHPYLSYLPLDRPIPGGVLESRRNGFSSGSMLPLAYITTPRMVRRGAISYDQTDVTAQYIRFLADAISSRNQYMENPVLLPDMPTPDTPTPNLNLIVPKSTGRRGSLKLITPASTYRNIMKHSVYQVFNIDVQGQVSEKLTKVNSWDFDVFAFTAIAEGRPLFHLGFHLLQKHNLINTLNLDIFKLMKFLNAVEDAYHPENCYHNNTHATDVTQALHCLLSEPKLYPYLTPIELLSAILAALCHDMDHPGVNQNYLVNTASPLAFIHGGASMLERHHSHQARAIILVTGILEHLTEEERTEVIDLLESMILATDVTQHADFISQFEELNSHIGPVDMTVRETRHFLLSIAIRAADISNPCRNLELSKNWSRHIIEEFFRQGDSERELNIPVSSFCDRHTTIIPKSQSGFFEFMARPLFIQWNKFFNTAFSNLLCENLERNKAYWDAQIHDEPAMEIPPAHDHHAEASAIKSDSSNELYVTVSDHSYISHSFDMDGANLSDDANQSYETELAHGLNEAFHTAQSQVTDNTDDTAQPAEDAASTAEPLAFDLTSGRINSVAAAIALWESRAKKSEMGSVMVEILEAGTSEFMATTDMQDSAQDTPQHESPPADEGPPPEGPPGSKEASK